MLLAPLFAAVLVGCGVVDDGSDGGEEDGDGDSVNASPLVVGFTGEDVSLDPNLSIATNWQGVLANFYDTLITRGADGELAPALATLWDQVDERTWQFELREDVTFHDGSPFTVEDVVYTLERVLDDELGSGQKGYLSTVDEVEELDEGTVQITTTEPFPLLAENLQFIPIVSASYIEANDDAALTDGVNGTGPYSLVSWEPGETMGLEAYSDHWRGEANVAEVVFRSIPETSARISALQAGEIDIAVNVPPDSAELLDGDDGVRVDDVISQRSIYIVLDNEDPVLQDPRVRRALNYAVDKSAIVDSLLMGYGEVLPSMVGSMYVGYNEELEPYPYDPDQARELLAEAGYEDGFTLTFNAPADRYTKDREIAQAIAAQLEDVGITVDLAVTEWGTYLEAYGEHQLGPAYLIGFGTPVWDFAVPFGSYLLPENAQSYYRDEEIEQNVRDAATISEPGDREAALAEINQTLYDDGAFLFLLGYQDLYGIADRVDWSPRADEKLWMYEAEITE